MPPYIGKTQSELKLCVFHEVYTNVSIAIFKANRIIIA